MNRAEQTREGSELQTTIKNIDELFNLNHKLEGDISALQDDYQSLSKRLTVSIDDSEIITNIITDPNDYVLLQALTPGLQQLGNFNVSGKGIIGTALGLGIAKTVSVVSPLQAAAPVWTIILGIGFSAAVGIFFGIFPANRAAQLNPIDALRYE